MRDDNDTTIINNTVTKITNFKDTVQQLVEIIKRKTSLGSFFFQSHFLTSKRAAVLLISNAVHYSLDKQGNRPELVIMCPNLVHGESYRRNYYRLEIGFVRRKCFLFTP